MKDSEMPIVFRSEGRPTNIVLSPNMKYVFIFCYDSGVSYNPLLFWAHRKWLHIWPIMRHLNCYRHRKLRLSPRISSDLLPATSYGCTDVKVFDSQLAYAVETSSENIYSFQDTFENNLLVIPCCYGK